MKITLIVLNLLAAVLVYPAIRIADKVHFHDAMAMYVELDRAQVIDRKRLSEQYPREMTNDRYEIPHRYVGIRSRASIVGYPCAIGFLLNAVLIWAFIPTKRPAQADDRMSGYLVRLRGER